jgi:hypothetical protein
MVAELHVLVMSNVGLSGPLDSPFTDQPGLAALQQLQHLDLSCNPSINGTLPDSWQSLTKLQHLNVSFNPKVTGTLPKAWHLLTSLQHLDVSHNPRISGSLPDSWHNLTQLQHLDVSFQPRDCRGSARSLAHTHSAAAL